MCEAVEKYASGAYEADLLRQITKPASKIGLVIQKETTKTEKVV